MWAVPESLGKDGPGELCGEVSVRVSTGKGKDILKLRAERKEKNASLGSRTEKWEVPGGIVERSV